MEALAHAVQLFGAVSAAGDQARAESRGEIGQTGTNGARSGRYRNERDKNLASGPQHAARAKSYVDGAEPATDQAPLCRDVDRSAAARHYPAARANVEQRLCQSRRDSSRAEPAVGKTVAFAPHASTRGTGSAEPDAHPQTAVGATG